MLRSVGFSTGDTHPSFLMGQEAWLQLDVSEREVARRREYVVAPVEDRDVLRALHRLPLGRPVRRDALAPRDAVVLGDAPSSVLRVDGEWVTRLASPPVAIRAAVVFDDTWNRGLDRASVFAGLCPRVLVLNGPSQVRSAVDLVEADFYGIGVVDGTSDEPAVLVQPDRTSKPFGPVSWRLAEQVFADIVSDPAGAI